ncbi:uncharacterized protein GGS22DRAFT_172947 [Annulohypoxylon maeteangense]|uniref:uncharacterized protein n=1 Tax=Annulohypoxylon maeteangense TaxID=1927788 RepID=UPI002008B900|nr:uncharacterized protein GGS22DRAFT_172947 [Annulohypoxylon maeteangense]KAI0881332.1 hypothetical protein GGS22DRAFT_172947 [Annulohypoxylon maeteangense]
MASSRISIAVIGTFDTKLDEFLYLRSRILEYDSSVNVILIDAGRSQVEHEAITVRQHDVLEASGFRGNLQSLPRSDLVRTMISGAKAVIRRLENRGEIQAIIGLGGSYGTTITSTVMQALPVTFPKLIVSTVASSDTSSYVRETDITMMYSVVDIAGLNEVLKAVVDNAATAIVGMAKAYCKRASSRPTEINHIKKGVGITMFGVTTKGVDVARKWLESNGFEVYVFHATGAGGRAMERLLMEGRLNGVLDLTTTELADELVGGVFPAGESRLTAAAKAGLPQIVSVGALDMVNFGPKDTIPQKFRERRIYEHNPSVTLMRTTDEECRELGRRISQKLKDNCIKPELTEVWLPLRGISAISTEGQAFHDKLADVALFAAIKEGLEGTAINIVEVDSDINDAHWAEQVARRLSELFEKSEKVAA